MMDFREKIQNALEAREITEEEYDQFQEMADQMENELQGLSGADVQHSIADITSTKQKVVSGLKDILRRGYSEEQRKNTPPRLGGEDTVLAEETGDQGYVMSYSEEARIKDQIRAHQDELNALNIVGSIQDTGWRGLSRAQFKQKIVEDLQYTGYQVDRENFGVIQFSKDLLEKSTNYLQTDAEAAAYKLLPKVLKRGVIIAGHEKHKGRMYDTVTIAAPVEINGKRGNMAVIVRLTKGNRYDVHRILTPDGGKFVLPEMKNAESTNGNLTTNGSQGKPIDSASINRIAEEQDSVKEFSVSDTQTETEEQDTTSDTPTAREQLPKKALLLENK